MFSLINKHYRVNLKPSHDNGSIQIASIPHNKSIIWYTSKLNGAFYIESRSMRQGRVLSPVDYSTLTTGIAKYKQLRITAMTFRILRKSHRND